MRHMRQFASLSFLVVVLLSSSAVIAQVILNPGSDAFFVRPINLEDTPFEEGDYCGNPDDEDTLNFKLGLKSSEGFLNIRWIAEDPAGIERNLGVDCWMNCPASPEQIAADPSVCSAYQSCSFRGPTGEHACSIIDPEYLYYADNKVSCRFYDLIDPSITLEAPERLFRTVDFDVQTSPLTLTIGAPASMVVAVKSFGILETQFTNNVSVLNNQDGLVFVTNGFADTESAICGQTVETIPSILFLLAKSADVSILTHGSVDETICSFDSECTYLDNGPFAGVCQNSVCWKRLDVEVDAGSLSLSEYNVAGFLAIVLSSFAVFAFAQRKASKRL